MISPALASRRKNINEHRQLREQYRAFQESKFAKEIPSPGPLDAPVFGKFKHSRKYFVDLLFDYHSNSVFFDREKAKTITYRKCYECWVECSPIDPSMREETLNLIMNWRHRKTGYTVSNSVIYERKTLPLHIVILCTDCVGKCS